MGRIARIGGWEHDLIAGTATWTRGTYEIVEIDSGPAPGPSEHFDYYPPEDRALLRKAYERSKATGEPFDLELRCNTAKGRTFSARAIGYPIFEDGKCVKVRGTFQDVTERKRADEELRKFRLAVEQSANGINITDLNGTIVYANPASEMMYGYGPGELVGQHVSVLNSQRKISTADIIPALKKDGQWTGELAQKRKDGSQFIVQLSASMLDKDGGQIGMLGIVRDITDRKQAEDDLAKAKEAAEAANRAKSEFLANMSHEIRTPMAAITGFTELLLSRERPPEEQREYLTTIQRNAESLLAIISDILDLSKIEAEKLQLAHMDWPPRQVVEEVETLMQEQAKKKGLRLEVNYLEPLPSAIHTDPGRLRQILVNLVGNAIKFTEFGGVRITVRSVPRHGGRAQIQFEVADTGVGISAEAVKVLFEPFTQVDMSSSRHYGGTGLGLSISQRLAEMMGGQIELESEPGKGSTFTLTIDAGPSQEAAPPNSPRERDEWTATGVCDSLRGRVLLADDIPDMAKLMQRTLQSTRLQVELAENGRVAYEKAMASKAAGKPYHLILMDIRMPVMDGYEATRRLRKDGWEGPIVALTSHSMRGDREKCLEAGCDDYLSKPVSQARLFEALERYLGCKETAAEQPPSERQARDRPTEGRLFDGLLDNATVDQLVQEYAETLPAKAEALANALGAQDLELVGRLAHELKGMASMYGFSAVSDQAMSLKLLTDEGDDMNMLESAAADLTELCREAAKAGQRAPTEPIEPSTDTSQASSPDLSRGEE